MIRQNKWLRKNRFLLLVAGFLFLSMLSCGKTALQMPERGICAHRGANSTHPENTLVAFREAIRLGAQMIEFDVWLTKDEKLVVIHDATVDRTTNGSGRVADYTLTELKKLDAGSWKGSDFIGEKIPTLEETLQIMPENIWLNVHIKEGAKAGRLVAEKIISTGRQRQAFLACNREVMQAARKVAPGILICNMERQNNTAQYVDDTIAMHADFIQLLHVSADRLPPITQKLKRHGIRINYFGTNSADELRALFAAGVDFPLVDDVAAMMKVAKGLGIKPVKPVVKR